MECVSKGGNFVNIGPNARGKFPKPAMKVLRDMRNRLKIMENLSGIAEKQGLETGLGGHKKRKLCICAFTSTGNRPIASNIPTEKIKKSESIRWDLRIDRQTVGDGAISRVYIH